MKISPEITYRGVSKTDHLEDLIHAKISKLEEVCDYINSCRIAVEKINDHPSHGSPYRVRLDITVPPGHEIVAESHPGEGVQHNPLDAVIREAFDAAVKQLKKLNRKQRESDRGVASEDV